MALPDLVDGHSCASVTLDGTGSTDPDGDSLGYHWDLLLAPFDSQTPLGAAAFVDPTSPTPGFHADVAGDYLAQLVVDDGESFSAPVSLPITLTPKLQNLSPILTHTEDMYVSRAPASCWSSCSAVDVGLDAYGTFDPDGDPVDLAWEILSGDADLSASEGPEVTLEIAPPPAYCSPTPRRNLVEVRVTATDCSGGVEMGTIVVAYDCG